MEDQQGRGLVETKPLAPWVSPKTATPPRASYRLRAKRQRGLMLQRPDAASGHTDGIRVQKQAAAASSSTAQPPPRGSSNQFTPLQSKSKIYARPEGAISPLPVFCSVIGREEPSGCSGMQRLVKHNGTGREEQRAVPTLAILRGSPTLRSGPPRTAATLPRPVVQPPVQAAVAATAACSNCPMLNTFPRRSPRWP